MFVIKESKVTTENKDSKFLSITIWILMIDLQDSKFQSMTIWIRMIDLKACKPEMNLQ